MLHVDGTEDYLLGRIYQGRVDEDDKEDATTPDDDIDELEFFSDDD